MRSPWSFESLSTFCHWPASLLAWPVLSADGPVGSETLGCWQRISASAYEPVETAATDCHIRINKSQVTGLTP